MKVGMFYEHKLPRRWTADSEYELFQNSLANQIASSRGAEIGGINLATPTDDAVLAGLRAALLDNLCIFFRSQISLVITEERPRTCN